MRNKCKNNFICILLVFAMIFSGMCYTDTDSFISYAYSTDTSSELDLLKGTTALPEVYSEKLFSKQESITASEESNSILRQSGARPNFQSVLVAVLPHFTYYTTMASSLHLHHEVASHKVIINYIHQKDGKKNI